MKNKLTLCAALCALCALIFSSARVLQSARDALALCAGLILPSRFPFFVLSVLLGKLRLPQLLASRLAPAAQLFGVSGAGLSALLVGLCGGYPLGAACAADLLREGVIDVEEAETLLAFCNNSGPAFLIGAVGTGVFSSPAAGLLLYLSHILAAVLTGLLLRRRQIGKHNSVYIESNIKFYVAFVFAVREAVGAVLTVCGFIVCFSVLSGLLDAWGLFACAEKLVSPTGLETQVVRALLCGFLELGGGVGAMRGLALTPGHLALASALVGWGGVSVHCQTAAVLCDAELSLRRHLLGRLMSAAVSAALSYAAALALLPVL